MKKGFFVALLLLSRVVLWAQWHDNVWLLGYNSNSADPLAEGIRFVFGDSLQIFYEKRPVPFANAYASFCDSSGRLLLHSNGCFVADSSGRPIPGSEGMNPGILHDIDCLKKRGYNLAQSMVLLQDPGNSQVFHFFHVPLANPVEPTDLLHTAVDLGANGGEGSTLFKNRVLVSDTIHYDGLHAVRHANGRDWWVVAAKQRSNKYYLLLLDPQGVRVQEQLVGVPTVSADRGEMAFSPDGRRLARYNPRDGLRLFNFDRCTGMLYHPQYIEVSGVHIGGLYAGMGWSADSRYLYLTDAYKLFQF
ncbi:MAG: hypothetical protein NZM43_01870, partial [Saprospiraceae bacterium]|nr:hypothetical protein [Saprospiraceae bacterium]MDW8483048.1 hypothetical protein [Saprospiraceae bacterium]